jgi:hypothetical protein
MTLSPMAKGFRISITQGGQTKFDQVYGLRESLKLWAYAGKSVAVGRKVIHAPPCSILH